MGQTAFSTKMSSLSHKLGTWFLATGLRIREFKFIGQICHHVCNHVSNHRFHEDTHQKNAEVTAVLVIEEKRRDYYKKLCVLVLRKKPKTEAYSEMNK